MTAAAAAAAEIWRLKNSDGHYNLNSPMRT